MNQKHLKGWIKHWDFILIDLFCLQISFIFAYWVVHGISNPYESAAFRYQLLLLFVCQLIVIFFTGNYRGILRRKKYDEGLAVCRHMGGILLLALVYMFLTHDSQTASRLQIGFTTTFFVVIDFFLRHLNKQWIIHSSAGEKGKKSVVLITSSKLLDEAREKLYKTDSYRDYNITRVVLMDPVLPEDLEQYDVPVTLMNDDTLYAIGHDWVDEAFILQPDDMVFPTELMDDLMTMGITVNYTLSVMSNDKWPNTDIRKMGEYKVITNSMRFASPGELAMKRVMDILGGIVGCIATGIIFLFVAPLIYKEDPGPIFFSQNRVGQNGKIFKLHKFRSMYMDAEARKAELMSQNRIKDGLMFKMDDDPRIIGSQKKDKNGQPKGIGNFIRNTSLDEFPQFFDVLAGNMSLVGWRPCTLEEWKKYDVEHRIRASMKPGITGMWQVSGRSKITDFDEVVRLDREYIEKWSLLLDIKILLKTVVVVLTRRGAE